MLVSGTAAAAAVGQCSRCLVDLTEPVIARIRELYAYPESTTAATTDDDELPRLVDDLVDLEPLVRDEVVLALPMAPLCRPDCPGLCAECGERFDDLEPGHSHEILDPRWAALRDRFDIPKHPRARTGHMPGPASNEKEIDRGCPEEEDVAQQHPFAPFAVEGHRADPGDLPEPGLRRADAPASVCPTCGQYRGRQVVGV